MSLVKMFKLFPCGNACPEGGRAILWNLGTGVLPMIKKNFKKTESNGN